MILDNTAAKQVLQRSGVGRIRHLSCRILWIQDLAKRKQLETASVPTKENYTDLGTKKLTQNRMRYLMHGVGVFNENSGELVGAEVVEREASQQDFKHVLRVLCESADGGRDRKNLLSAKRTLRMLLLTTMINTADALSLPSMMSPMESILWPQLEVLGSLSFWMLLAPVLFCIFAAVFMFWRFN